MSHAKARVLQYIVIILILATAGGGYWYWKNAQASVVLKTADKTGLVGYWSFDEGDGTQAGDASGYGNTGTLTSGPTWVDGKLGKALSFDGVDDYIRLGGLNISAASDFTLCVWLRPTAWVGPNPGLWRDATLSDGNNFNIFQGATGRPWIRWNGTDILQPASGYSVPLNEWTYVCYVVRSSADASFYANGALKHSATHTAATPAFTIFNYGYQYSVGERLQGIHDDVRVYSRALSATEISNLYALGAAKVNTSQNTNLTSGLVGLWSFDGADVSGTTAYDRSGNANNGTLTNGPTPTIGKMGQALSFDGTDDYVSAPNSASLQFANAAPITLSAWVKPSQIAAYSTFLVKGRYTDDSEANYAFRQGTTGKKLEFYYNESGSTTWHVWTSTADVFTVPNQWYHVAVTYTFGTGTSLIAYIDGSAVTGSWAGSGNAAPDVSTQVLLLGKIGLGERFSGTMDEVRIYNRVLSASEVTALYAQGTATVNASRNASLTSGLVGLWSFDGADVSGTTAYDRSGNANNGTLTNGPTATIGKVGQALNFDGTNDYGTITNSASLQITGDMAISVWVNLSNNANYNPIISRNGTYEYEIAADLRSGVTTLAWRSTNVSSGGWANFFSGYTDKWVYVTVVVSGTNATAYRNGVSMGAIAIGTRSASTQPLLIGNRVGGYYFKGTIDEPRIYNRALSAAEVTALYDLGR